jgi:ribosomal protein S18 acetylase RimI-like enzyme
MKNTPIDLIIRQYEEKDQLTVMTLWQKCNLTRPWNNPERDIARKLRVNRELFLVGLINGKVIATIMGGYEGHRGWINYLAVDQDYRKNGLGKQLMSELEKTLQAIGCPKVNLQVRADNKEALAFYENLGYDRDDVVSFGKRLIKDN